METVASVASVAQLVGLDAATLISMTMHAALTARRSSKECEQLVRRIFLMAELLPHIQDPEMMARPEIRRALAGLDDTLREAHKLFTSCQGRSAAYKLVLSWRLADRFKEVRSRIDFYISAFPLIFHISTTIRLDRIHHALLPDHAPLGPRYGQSQLHGTWELSDVAQEFTLAEMLTATNKFAEESEIGRSCYGSTVYKGRLRGGREVAIKRFTQLERELESFRWELAVHLPLRHEHIVRLLGWCTEKEKERRLLPFRKKKGQCLLVFEHMANGTLEKHLHDESSSSSPVRTSWKVRIEVLLGVSRAIHHLHCTAVPSVIHRDIKPANILLDARWAPRLSDFDGSVTFAPETRKEKECQGIEPDILGTRGYIDPEYCNTGFLKRASDVYSFGVVMLETLTGKNKEGVPSFDEQDEDIDFSSFVFPSVPIIEGGQLREILDKRPEPEPMAQQLEALELVAQTAAHCVRLQGADRPAIQQVVAKLETALELISTSPASHCQQASSVEEAQEVVPIETTN